MKYQVFPILVLAWAATTAHAQDDFDPVLPGEPNAQYKVTVGISHPEAGRVAGGGSYATGTNITVSKSDAWVSESDEVYYSFQYWTLNGEEYTTDSSFEYTVGTNNVNFVAVYEVVAIEEVTSRVHIVMSPADACDNHTTDNRRYFEGDNAYIYCYARQGFDFLGWYEGNSLVSRNQHFYYQVGKDDVTLTAKFFYNPAIPAEPDCQQVNVDNLSPGDVNKDGRVDVLDVVICVDVIQNNKVNNRADMNKDGVVDQSDVVRISTKVLTHDNRVNFNNMNKK